MSEVADHINHALLEPLEEYRLTEDIPKLPLEEDQLPEFLVVTEEVVYTRLSRLNPVKAGGPDGIPNWVLREYAEFLAYPISVILSAFFKEQRLPSIWKLADVTPLPKQKPVKEIKKDLRPISLTPCISKLAEDFVVTEYVKPVFNTFKTLWVAALVRSHAIGLQPFRLTKEQTTQTMHPSPKTIEVQHYPCY